MYILLIGGGSTGRALASHLIGEGHEIVIVEDDEERAKSLAEAMDALIIHGDGSDPEILKDAGVERADAAAVVTPDDNINLTVCQILKKFNVPRIVARVNEPGKKDLYIGLQITAAISPTAAVVSYFKNALTQGSSKSMMSIANGLEGFKRGAGRQAHQGFGPSSRLDYCRNLQAWRGYNRNRQYGCQTERRSDCDCED